MQYEFLSHFARRMKNVGLYTVLLTNSIQKTTWQKYGFVKADEQINVVFSVLLYIMEQSLREENCTMDDIGAFIDTINMNYFMKNLTYEECKNLGDFIVNVVLCNEGKAMYFDGYDFKQRAYQIMHVSYVANHIVYVDYEVKRTSYHLTDDGYNLLLGTLEIENNMQITIHEMIFKLHLEKQSYDKAVDEIKSVFNLMRIQLQKIQEAMGKIRHNALGYSVADYDSILNENLETISDTKRKFQNYRDLVKARAKQLEEVNISVKKLDEKEEEKLNNLKVIEGYLTRTIDEHQRILNGHFDLKALYTKELEALSQMSLIKRFPLRTELYDKMLTHPTGLEEVDYFLRPLFLQDIGKIYNLNKALEYQKPMRARKEEEETELLEFDGEEWQEEQERKQREKLKKYEGSLRCILEEVMGAGELTLLELQARLQTPGTEEKVRTLIPNTEIFKEIMVELIRGKEIDIPMLRKERSEFIQEKADSFQLNEMLLDLLEQLEGGDKVSCIEVYKVEGGNAAEFRDVPDTDGHVKTIRCSNVLIRVVEKMQE